MPIFKTLHDRFKKDVSKLRSQIPEQYNQAELAEFILDDDIDLLMSITTRGDGKSFQYFNLLINLAIKYEDFKLTIVARHYTLRLAYANLIEEIIQTVGSVDATKLLMRREDDFIRVYYDSEPIALITDLMNATDLKYQSSVLRNFRFIVYDEFLALDGDYLPDEADRLKTIYESIDRGANELLPNPKILLLGNPVNFNSPLLAYWDMFDILEKQPMNTVRKYGNKVVERFRNDNINERKNNRLFATLNNSSITGEFKVNNTLVASDSIKQATKHRLIIMLGGGYKMTVFYNDTKDYYISFDAVPTDEYDFTLDLEHFKQGVRIINQYDYASGLSYAYEDGSILFSDTFSVNYMDKHPHLKELNIEALISEKMASIASDDAYIEKNIDRLVSENHTKQIKKKLFREYFGL